jgi:hypothetical protein
MNFRVAPWTKRKHQAQDRLARDPVMHDDRPFIPPGSITNPAAIAVAFQHRFTQSPEILFILTFQRVAGRTQAEGENLLSPAWTVKRALN